jgi:transcriptional regulator with GAF, ATPase, and Fis domain
MAWLACEHSITKAREAFRIRKPLVALGRAKANDLVLDDPMVAPTHVTLMRQGEQFTLQVTPSASPVYVNGKSTRSSALKFGDGVLLGAWLVTLRDGDPPEAPNVEVLPATPSLGLLEQLVSLSADLMADTSPEVLFSRLLSGLVQVTRAEKGFVVVLRDEERHIAAAHNVDNRRTEASLSDSIVDAVIQSRQPLIVSDALQDTRFGKAQSVVDLRLSSVMCVPLTYQGDLLGVIYLGNDSITNLFGERDLSVLKIYASQASIIVYHALMLNRLKLDNANLRRQLETSQHGTMFGTCPPMKALFRTIERVARSDLSVLVLGETGTGKELVARELHNGSLRAKQAFIAINCGAIPENLLESELFGHRKGAFTGAVADKLGKIEAADKGTLFLDEIGEMPMNLQVKLLRVLQERVIERVGDVTGRPIDIRVVAATNKSPSELIQAGLFREDLWYRLNEMTVELPPLRDRGDDIVVLAQYFLHKYREQYGMEGKGFSPGALTAMRAWYWPGNVRELEGRVKKALILSDRPQISEDDLGLKIEEKKALKSLADAQEEFKTDYIRKALEINNWNKAQTARELDIDARTVFRYIERIREIEG